MSDESTVSGLRDLLQVVDAVSRPVSSRGCPWVTSSSPLSIMENLRSELQEVSEELTREPLERSKLEEELGDVLFCALLMARVAERDHGISIEQSLKRICEKIKWRCPHVFGDASAETAEEASALWVAQKKKEKEMKKAEEEERSRGDTGAGQ